MSDNLDRLVARAAPERWRRHPDCDAYEISTWGRVRRIKPAQGARVGRILKPYGEGRYVQLHCDGKIIVTNYKIGDHHHGQTQAL